jgi:hypothetical protein
MSATAQQQQCNFQPWNSAIECVTFEQSWIVKGGPAVKCAVIVAVADDDHDRTFYISSAQTAYGTITFSACTPDGAAQKHTPASEQFSVIMYKNNVVSQPFYMKVGSDFTDFGVSVHANYNNGELDVWDIICVVSADPPSASTA